MLRLVVQHSGFWILCTEHRIKYCKAFSQVKNDAIILLHFPHSLITLLFPHAPCRVETLSSKASGKPGRHFASSGLKCVFLNSCTRLHAWRIVFFNRIFADAWNQVEGEVLEILEAVVAGKAQAKDASMALQSVSEKLRDAKFGERLPDMLWLLGEECMETHPEGSAHRNGYKSLIQELLVRFIPCTMYHIAKLALCMPRTRRTFCAGPVIL
jgi:hypothetical protein